MAGGGAPMRGLRLAFGLGRTTPGVPVVHLSTPVSVTSYPLAVGDRADADPVAGLVVVSKALSVVPLPALLALFVRDDWHARVICAKLAENRQQTGQ